MNPVGPGSSMCATGACWSLSITTSSGISVGWQNAQDRRVRFTGTGCCGRGAAVIIGLELLGGEIRNVANLVRGTASVTNSEKASAPAMPIACSANPANKLTDFRFLLP